MRRWQPGRCHPALYAYGSVHFAVRLIALRTVPVDEHTIELAGAPIFYRSAPGPDDSATPIYLHGIPTSSDDWLGLLERTGGIAPDLIGFGRSSKAANLDYTLSGLATFLEQLLARLGIEQATIVAHEWGAAAGLVFAQRHPTGVRRLVLCNALPLTGGFRWQRPAALIRKLGVGELLMGSTPRWLLGRTLRGGCVNREAFSERRLRSVWEQFDQGTQRAILRLHRSASEENLAAAGAELEILQMPTLIIWGEQDPWLPAAFANAYGERLAQATVYRVPDAGHWPWLERAEVAERIAGFIHQ